ncbi:hypothetical protein CO610_07990 [Lysobacteraceae bacterium NML95-0200]|nr:hypothetical protein CO610_07990 [Xanthomonadaceae bacterium NML95-0200]
MNMQKSKENPLQHGMRLPRPSRLSFALGLAVAVATGAGQAATSFPDYPLQTSVTRVPPNIMFILDDSGSMRLNYMPIGPTLDFMACVWSARYWDSEQNARCSNWDLPEDERKNLAYFYRLALGLNAIAYDPMKEYKPWRTANGGRLTAGTTIHQVSNHDVDATTFEGEYSERRQGEHGTYPYAISLLGSKDAAAFFIPKRVLVTDDEKLDRKNYWYYTIDKDTGKWIRREYVLRPGGVYNWWNHTTIDPPTKPGVDPYVNYATWYTYHRTRAKIAKAGASEAFSDLGEQYRVGFDVINRTGSSPNMGIPVETDSGLFRGVNKSRWFNRLHRVNANGWTPLRNSLHRTGVYFRDTKKIWTVNGTGLEYSCRRNYAILTTDGYWNDTGIGGRPRYLGMDGEGSPYGNSDGTSSPPNYAAARPYMDSHSDTLADIAMYFWKTDLRPDLVNDVAASIDNPATWQHMVTFPISIGLQGTLEPTDATLARLRSGVINWPNPLLREDATRIDDLWHAAINSRGGFVAADDADKFSEALIRALSTIARESGAGGGLGDTGRKIGGGSRIYQGRYQSGSWDGDVQAFAFSSGDTANAPQLWSLAQHTLNPDLFATGQGFATRPIFTWGQGGGGAPLSLAALGSKAALLARTSSSSAVSAIDNLNYLKGDRSLEKVNGGRLRDRSSSLIGDIVNSVPEYVAENDSLFVGANDGMLHAINAADGRPLFSYMPRGIDYRALATLSDPYYQHRFFVDGIPRVSRRSITAGKNILVSSLGRGGRGLFALDVTHPASFAAANVLWDEDHTVNADIGYILSQPLIVPGNHGGTLMITANGLESQGGNAKVLVYELNAAGRVTARHAFGQTGGSGNGMTSFTAYDRNADGQVDIVYAGDIQGNVWKIDLSGSSAASWGVANSGSPMFTARDASGALQPITGGLTVTVERRTGRAFVSFGTGKYLSEQDKDVSGTLQTQTLYTLIDGDTPVTGRAQLQQRTFPYLGTSADGRAVRGAENYSELPASARGWYLDLGVPASLNRGERIVTRPELSGELLAVTSLVPKASQGCSSEIGGYLTALNVFTGTNPRDGGYFDFNGDGAGDKIPGTQGHISSVDLGRGTGGVRLYRNEDGSLSAVTPGLDGSLLTTKLLGGGSRGERVNWRELVRSN